VQCGMCSVTVFRIPERAALLTLDAARVAFSTIDGQSPSDGHRATDSYRYRHRCRYRHWGTGTLGTTGTVP
jgi:hypothetical protein